MVTITPPIYIIKQAELVKRGEALTIFFAQSNHLYYIIRQIFSA